MQSGPRAAEHMLRQRTMRARVARDRRETASVGPTAAQLTDLRLLQPDPAAAFSRAVERFAEQRVFLPRGERGEPEVVRD